MNTDPNNDPPVQGTPPETQQPGSQPRQVSVRLETGVRQAYVTYTIMAVTIVIFLLQVLSETAWGVDVPLGLGAKINQSILKGQIWRLITPMLLHGSVIHIMVNMYALYGIGRGLERYYGHARYLALYLLGSFTGNVLSFIFSPSISVGSSTAIFGLLAAEGVLVYQNRTWFGNRFQSIFSNILAVAAVNLVIGFTVSGIDNWGHLGGLLGGIGFAWFAGPKWEITGISPFLELHDKRTNQQAVVTFIGMGLLFSAITLGAVLLNIPQP